MKPEMARTLIESAVANYERVLAIQSPYFASLGEQLGYEKVSYYAHLFGLGEKAGLDIPGEHAGRHLSPSRGSNPGVQRG